MAVIPALMPVIVETTLAAAAASVNLTVPNGHEVLFLEWHNVKGDHADIKNFMMRFNSDAGGNYDISEQNFSVASSTTNATTRVTLGFVGDSDGIDYTNSGQVIIFNRTSQEKVVIGTTVFFDDSAGAGADDLTGRHIEAKWRNTSNPITSITLLASGGNLTANSKFILRGLRTTGAPALGSQDIMQFIGEHTVSGAEASVTLPTFPVGYGMLLLFWHDLHGDHTDVKQLVIRFNADSGGNYDYSWQAFGTASSTTNAGTFIRIGVIADSDADDYVSSGFALILNRSAQEKLVIGTEAFFDNSAGANADDVTGRHTEGKWRNTSAEISSIAMLITGGNFDAGKIWLVGVKIP